jgi:PAS domain S-box-containing protein
LFALFLVILKNYSPYDMYFSDFITPAINLSIALILFYTAAISRHQGSRIYLAWMFLAIAQTSFLIGDILWGFFDIGFFQDTSMSDFFYILYYFIFIIGILFFSRDRFRSLTQIKVFLDILIVTISAAMIFLTLLILPLISSVEGFTTEVILSLVYIFLDFLLFVALISFLYGILNKKIQTAFVLLALGVFFQIITDFIYSFLTINGGYTSGNLIDTGWIIGYIFVGLAVISQIKDQEIDFDRIIPKRLFKLKKYNLGIYIPVVLIIMAYISQIWGYNNLNSSYLYLLDYGVGILVLLVLTRQIIALKENRSLYYAAKEENDKREIIEKALQKSEQKYRGIVENANEGIISTDLEGNITFVNNRFAKMVGYGEKELIGMHIFSLMDEESIQTAQVCMMNVKKGRKSLNELKFIKKDGNSVNVLNHVSPVMDNGYNGCIALISDITGIKEAEEIIKQSLSEKEILLREIHHRVKNNMQIISSMLSLQSNYINDQEVQDIFKESQNRVIHGFST